MENKNSIKGLRAFRPTGLSPRSPVVANTLNCDARLTNDSLRLGSHYPAVKAVVVSCFCCYLLLPAAAAAVAASTWTTIRAQYISRSTNDIFTRRAPVNRKERFIGRNLHKVYRRRVSGDARSVAFVERRALVEQYYNVNNMNINWQCELLLVCSFVRAYMRGGVAGSGVWKVGPKNRWEGGFWGRRC